METAATFYLLLRTFEYPLRCASEFFGYWLQASSRSHIGCPIKFTSFAHSEYLLSPQVQSHAAATDEKSIKKNQIRSPFSTSKWSYSFCLDGLVTTFHKRTIPNSNGENRFPSAVHRLGSRTSRLCCRARSSSIRLRYFSLFFWYSSRLLSEIGFSNKREISASMCSMFSNRSFANLFSLSSLFSSSKLPSISRGNSSSLESSIASVCCMMLPCVGRWLQTALVRRKEFAASCPRCTRFSRQVAWKSECCNSQILRYAILLNYCLFKLVLLRDVEENALLYWHRKE